MADVFGHPLTTRYFFSIAVLFRFSGSEKEVSVLLSILVI